MAIVLARTSTGFIFPLLKKFENDTNWLKCGKGAYFAGYRHIGSDLSCKLGDHVIAIANGRIVRASGPKASSGWGEGNYGLLIRHQAEGIGDFVAVYGHIKPTVVSGDVTAGQVIGRVGPWPNGVHLHFGIHPGGRDIPAPLGRIADSTCKNKNSVNGFVAPITFILTRKPK